MNIQSISENLWDIWHKKRCQRVANAGIPSWKYSSLLPGNSYIISHMLHGAGIFNYITKGGFVRANVGKYSSTMEHMGLKMAPLSHWWLILWYGVFLEYLYFYLLDSFQCMVLSGHGLIPIAGWFSSNGGYPICGNPHFCVYIEKMYIGRV